MVHWGVESVAFDGGQLPADKLDWRPTPEGKSALKVIVPRLVAPKFTHTKCVSSSIP